MAKKIAIKNSKPDDWKELTNLIQVFADASIAESWKGGGDPLDVPILELQLELSRVILNTHILKMQRELTGETNL